MMSTLPMFTLWCSILSITLSTRCFDSCIAADPQTCDQSDICTERCGESLSGTLIGFSQSFPAFISVDCASECLWGEFNFTRATNNFFILAFPFGCKENYTPERISSDIADNIKYSNGVNLFSCEGEFCNLPPLNTECGIDEVLEYTESFSADSPCYITNSKFQETRFNPLRRLGTDGVPENIDFRNRCVDFNSTEVSALGLRRFNSLDIEIEYDFLTCEECENTNGCSIDDEFIPEVISPTPAPENTNSPTSSSSGTQSPTLDEETKSDKDPEDKLALEFILLLVRTKDEQKRIHNRLAAEQFADAEVLEDGDKTHEHLPLATQMPLWPVERNSGNGNVLDDLEDLNDEEKYEKEDLENLVVERKVDIELDFRDLE
eukprot:snap_masked-scaffold_3-processed-gene-20.19-mRNA-1 protein AED:1.00 eAED:1.00 QI:0/0/0/0/1/1/2/0/376